MAGYRIAGKRADQLIEAHSEEEIIAALDAADAWMEAKESRRETIANPAGVAYKAITEGWKLPAETTPAAITHDGRGQEETQAAEERARSEKRREARRGEFRRSWYLNFVETTPPEELEPLKEAFRESLSGNKLVLDRYKKNGLTGLVLGVFQHFLAARGIEPDEEAFQTYLKEKAPSAKKEA